MIPRLIERLRAAGLDVVAGELADAIWLAGYLPAALTPVLSAPRVQKQSISETKPPTDPVAVPTEPLRPPPPPPPVAPVVPDYETQLPPEREAVPFRAPSVRALVNGSDVARSLRPMRRFVPSRSGFEYDEAATVAAIARAGVDGPWLPVVRRGRERWLELALVLDTAESMSLWRPLLAELRLLLARLGAFRDVRTWALATSEWLQLLKGANTKRSTSQVVRRANELLDPAGRRVILLVSDCVSRGWRSGAVQRLLAHWGRRAPVALLQVLPEELWSRTALRGAPRVLMSPSRAGATNAQLRLTAPARADEGIRVPVVSLDPRTLHMWASVVAGLGRSSVPGVAFEGETEEGGSESPHATRPSPDRTGQERLRLFRRSASPQAQELAELLSAAPLYQPVMRLVWQTVLPGATQGHMAEVFLGGLMRRVTPRGEQIDPDEVRYEFFPGVREELRENLGSSDGLEVIARVSDFLRQRVGQSRDFRALLLDPTSGRDAGPSVAGDEMFAKFAAPFLRRMGGRYAKLADRLERLRDQSDVPPLSDAAEPPMEGKLAEEGRRLSPSVPSDRGPTRADIHENGFWVLVDGTEGLGVPLHQVAIAEALGSHLALCGFSLLTLGTQGVAHIVSRSFLAVLARNLGISSGIHRIVSVGPSTDFDWGRLITTNAGAAIAAAVSRADAVMFVGASSRSMDIERQRATTTRIPAIWVVDPPDSFRPGTDDLSQPPTEWGSRETERYCKVIAARLLAQLGTPEPEDPGVAPLLTLAERALDQQDLKEYHTRLDEIRPSLVSTLSPPLISSRGLAWVTHPRRVSNRLVGFQCDLDLDASTLCRILQAERLAVRNLWETRTLWFALVAIEELLPLATGEGDPRALAAQCMVIEFDMLATPADKGGECRQLLHMLVERDASMARARRLADLAGEYDSIRANTPSSHERTARMSAVVDRMTRSLDGVGAVPEAEVWIRGGAPGHRIVALSLLLASPVAAGFPVVDDCIGRAMSPFEQYLALRAAHSMIDAIDAASLDRLVKTIEKVRERDSSPRVRIDDRDRSRWDLSERILARALNRLATPSAIAGAAAVSSLSVFLSYAGRDSLIARCISRYLKPYGMQVWVEEHELTLGSAIEEAKRKAIEAAHTVVVVATAAATANAWVARELVAARVLRKRVIPIFLAHVETHEQFRDLHGLDATRPADFADAVHQLLTVIFSSPGQVAPPIDKAVLQTELRLLAEEEPDLAPLILGYLDSQGLHRDNVETVRRAPFHALDFALNSLYAVDPSELAAMHAAYGFAWAGAGARALALWIERSGDGGLPLVTAMGERLEPPFPDTAIKLLGKCATPNNHALYTFISNNAVGLDPSQRAAVVRLVTYPVRGPERLGDVLGWVASSHLQDAPEIPRMWSRWVDSGAFDHGHAAKDLARYMADARKEGLPGWDVVAETLRTRVRSCVRSGDKAKISIALDHLRAAADADAPVRGALIKEIGDAPATAEWQEWEDRDLETAEEMECYVYEFARAASSDRDWVGAARRAKEYLGRLQNFRRTV